MSLLFFNRSSRFFLQAFFHKPQESFKLKSSLPQHHWGGGGVSCDIISSTYLFSGKAYMFFLVDPVILIPQSWKFPHKYGKFYTM